MAEPLRASPAPACAFQAGHLGAVGVPARGGDGAILTLFFGEEEPEDASETCSILAEHAVVALWTADAHVCN